jgi:hypothetical protein
MIKLLTETTLPLHLICILILFAFYIGLQLGITKDERHRDKVHKAVLKRKLDRQPKAFRIK